MTLFTIALVLFLIMDPIGNVSSFVEVLKPYTPRKRHLIVLREMLFALMILLFFYFFGDYLFKILQISETTVRISSGVILFLIALTIIFPSSRNVRLRLSKEEPFIIPLAVPLIAGPALIATVMLYTHLLTNQTVMFGAILISWFASLAVLMFSGQINRILGQNGLLACEKLMGMILILIAVQRFMDGITSFINVYKG